MVTLWTSCETSHPPYQLSVNRLSFSNSQSQGGSFRVFTVREWCVRTHTGGLVHFSRNIVSVFSSGQNHTHLPTFSGILSVRVRRPTPPADLPPSSSIQIIPNIFLLFHFYTIYTYVAERTMFTSSAGFIYSGILWSFTKEYKYIDHTVFNHHFVLYSFSLWFSFCCTFPLLAYRLACFMTHSVYIAPGGRRAGSGALRLGKSTSPWALFSLPEEPSWTLG